MAAFLIVKGLDSRPRDDDEKAFICPNGTMRWYSSGDGVQGLVEIVDEVLSVLNAYRKPEEVIRYTRPDPFGLGKSPVGCQCGGTDERLDTTEAYGEEGYSELPQELSEGIISPLYLKAHHTAEPLHLALCELVLGMTLQAWVVDPSDTGMVFKESGDLHPVLVVGFHSDLQGLDTPHQ